MPIVTINSVNEIDGKWANFNFDDNKSIWAKYGYFSYLMYSACDDQLGSHPDFPVKCVVDSLDNFIVEKIFHKGLWVKLLPRGY